MLSKTSHGKKRSRDIDEDLHGEAGIQKRVKETLRDETIANPEVRSKISRSARIVGNALSLASEMCLNKNVSTKVICTVCDKFIMNECEKEYIKTVDPQTSTKIAKGVCFPTTVCVNNIVCNYSASNESLLLKAHDIVKISTGCHIDGYPAVATRTIYVAPQAGEPNEAGEGTLGDKILRHRRVALIKACNGALQSAVDNISIGIDSKKVSQSILDVADKYNVTALPHALSHEMKRFVLNGHKAFFSCNISDGKVSDTEEFLFEKDKIYHIDVLFGMLDKSNARNFEELFSFPTHIQQMKGGEERKLFDLVPSESHMTTVFSRNINKTAVRPEVANNALRVIKEKFLTFPFVGRSVFPDSEVKSAMGVKSLAENNLLDSFSVLESKKFVTTARACCTVIVTENKTQVLCGEIIEAHEDVSSGMTDILPFNEVASKDKSSNIYQKIVGPLQPFGINEQ